MRIEVMSRRTVEEYNKMYHADTSILISISSFNDREANVSINNHNKIKDILFLKFDDVDNDGGITPMDAAKIKGFVSRYKDGVDKIIVQCGAGQSRSAGVAAALMVYFNRDDSPIFNNPRYTPNMRCYRTVLEEMFSG